LVIVTVGVAILGVIAWIDIGSVPPSDLRTPFSQNALLLVVFGSALLEP